jgi:hypothetical protein
MLVCAFLPFLPLIEDAMIRQLGDDDFAKREAATRNINRALRDTDGCRNYSLLLKVKRARGHKSTDVKARAEKLYNDNKSRYPLEHLYFAAVFSIAAKTGVSRSKVIEKEAGVHSDIKAHNGGSETLFIPFRSSKCSPSELYQINSSPHFRFFVSVPNEMLRRPGGPVGPAIDKIIDQIAEKEEMIK